MLQAALVINILVLIPVCIGLLKGSRWTLDGYGPDSPARRILLAIYLSILIFTAVCLRWPHHNNIIVLLVIQIVYKLLSAITVRNLRNPVVISNLLIALFHSLAIYMQGFNRTVNWID